MPVVRFCRSKALVWTCFERPNGSQWAAIRSFPPNKQRGPRVDERRVPNGIFFIRTIAFDKERDLRGRDHGRKRDR
jgi:hypothetical protein